MSKHPLLDCGNCISPCCVIPGAVDVSKQDIKNISQFLSISVEEFENIYVSVENGNEIIKSGVSRCPFLNRQNKCSIYSARPQTCRNYFCWENKDTSYQLALKQKELGLPGSSALKVQLHGSELQLEISPVD